MRCSPSIAALAPALVAAQAELKAIGRDATNPRFQSRYASLDAIIESVRPVLAKHQLALIQGGLEGPDYGVETTIMHRSGEWISTSIVIPLSKNDPQSAGGATTYGRRYGASALLALVTDDDDDAESTAVTPISGARTASAPPARTGGPIVMPFGKFKGTALGKLPNEELARTIRWCRETDAVKFKDLINTCSTILNDRALGQTEEEVVTRALSDEQDDLPF